MKIILLEITQALVKRVEVRANSQHQEAKKERRARELRVQTLQWRRHTQHQEARASLQLWDLENLIWVKINLQEF
jgi:hypothetical protein